MELEKFDFKADELISMFLINIDVDLYSCNIEVVAEDELPDIVEEIKEEIKLEKAVFLIPTQIHEIFDPDLQKFYMYFEIKEDGLAPKEIILTENAGLEALLELSKICKKILKFSCYDN